MTKKPRTKTVKLDFPIEWEGKEISEITLRRPKGKDMQRIAEASEDANKVAVNTETLSALTDLPREVIGELDFEDYNALSEAVADFFPERAQPGDGGPSSPTALPH